MYGQSMTAGLEYLGQGILDRASGTVYLGQGIQDRTARTGQLERTVGTAKVAGNTCRKEMTGLF
jgi:hypothetical protein